MRPKRSKWTVVALALLMGAALITPIALPAPAEAARVCSRQRVCRTRFRRYCTRTVYRHCRRGYCRNRYRRVCSRRSVGSVCRWRRVCRHY
ncbi:MAG: hypothetical protein KC609_07535 [Myxococcales bacterium]|nr:hypothetical protein [Myxococcales bacterium]